MPSLEERELEAVALALEAEEVMELKLPVTEPETVEPEEVDWGIELERLGADETDCVIEADDPDSDGPLPDGLVVVEPVPDGVVAVEPVPDGVVPDGVVAVEPVPDGLLPLELDWVTELDTPEPGEDDEAIELETSEDEVNWVRELETSGVDEVDWVIELLIEKELDEVDEKEDDELLLGIVVLFG